MKFTHTCPSSFSGSLAPFDMAKVLKGQPVCYKDGNHIGLLIHHNPNFLVIEWDDMTIDTFSKSANRTDALRMKPLCWFNNKPVYKNQSMWHVPKNGLATPIEIIGFSNYTKTYLSCRANKIQLPSIPMETDTLIMDELPKDVVFFLDGKPVTKSTPIYRPYIADNGDKPLYASGISKCNNFVYLVYEDGSDAGSEYINNKHGCMIWGLPIPKEPEILGKVEGKPVTIESILYAKVPEGFQKHFLPVKAVFHPKGRIAPNHFIGEMEITSKSFETQTIDVSIDGEDLTWDIPLVQRIGVVILTKENGVTVVRNGKVYENSSLSDEVSKEEQVVGCVPITWNEPAF